jgi:ribose 5-phosphate isomerase B
MKKIYIGADHAGFALKEQLKSFLDKNKIAYEDLGAFVYNKDDDYPDFALKVAHQAVKNNAGGILICGSGQGMCVTANKVKGAMAVLVNNEKDAKQSREHINSNVLCLPGYLTVKKANAIVKIWLNTKFTQAIRHKRRLEKIRKIEQSL